MMKEEENIEGIKTRKLLQHDQQILSKVSSKQQFKRTLQDINIHIQALDIEQDDIHSLLYGILKPISRQITNSPFVTSVMLQSIQSCLKNIVRIYVRIFVMKSSLSSLQIIKELLSRGGSLFIKTAVPIQQNTSIQDQQEHLNSDNQQLYKWTKYSPANTLLHRQLCELVMVELEGIQHKFNNMKINITVEYLKYLYYMSEFIIDQRIKRIVQITLSLYEQQFQQPSKETIKQAELEIIQKLSDVLIQLLRFDNQLDLKHRCMLLGPKLGLSLLNKPSIQKRIVGVKLLSAFSTHFYIKTYSFMSQGDFGQWLQKQNVFQTIFQPNCHINIIKSAHDLFRIYLRKSLLTKQRLINYLQLIDEVSIQIRRTLFKYLDPFRLCFNMISIILQRYKTLKKPNFYIEQFFMLIEGLSRYSVASQLQIANNIIQDILYAYYDIFMSNSIKNRCLDSSIFIFKKIYCDINKINKEQLVQACLQYTNKFIQNPSELRLICLQKIFNEMSDQEYCCMVLVSKKLIEGSFLLKCFELLRSKMINYNEKLLIFLESILDKYNIHHSTINFSSYIFQTAIQYPQLFNALLKLHDQNHLEELMHTLIGLIQQVQFPFSCIRNTFYKLNNQHVFEAHRQYYQKKINYLINTDPANLISLQTIKILINHQSPKIRQQCAELISQVYTCFTDEFRQKGELLQQEFMQHIIQVVIKCLQESNYQSNELIGWLSIIQQMMLATENLGVGQLKPHNSLIATSTSLLRIQNDLTYGDDVLKVFQKRVPSNTTLFELLIQISRLFKCGPQDILLKDDQIILYPKYNGLTLEELQLNNKKLTAHRTHMNRLRKEPLVIDGKVSYKALKVFQQIYHRFAPENRMTERQCAHYVESVTQSGCTMFDNRVKMLFDEYDIDKDGNLTLEDFIKFNCQSALSMEKQPHLWKNLQLLRYRRDLKMYNEPLDDIDDSTLFRLHLSKSEKVYELLFNLVDSPNSELRCQSIKLLGRLPTYSKIIQQQVQFEQINTFKTQYVLIALQNYCSLKNQMEQTCNAKKFIQSGGAFKLFKLIKQIYYNKSPNYEEDKCRVVAIRILRQLIPIPYLGHKLQPEKYINFKLELQLPKHQLFLSMLTQMIQNDNMTIFEPLLVLQLTQIQIQIHCISKVIFHRDKQIRQIVCVFLYFWQLKSQFSLPLFDIPIHNSSCEEWFNLLTAMIEYDPNIDVVTIFNNKLEGLCKEQQNFQNMSYNQVINGNLRIIEAAIKRQPKLCAQKRLQQVLDVLIEHTISPTNRKLIYQLRSRVNLMSTLDYMQNLLVRVEAVGDLSMRVHYVGLKNLGSICYMNSILQQFLMMPQFRGLVEHLKLQDEHLMQTQVNGRIMVDNFIYQMKKMYTYLYYSHKKYYSPDEFCLTIKNQQKQPISLNIQEDAHQFLNLMFEQVENCARKQDNTLKQLESLYKGKTIAEITCLKCHNRITKEEDYYHLSLQVKGYNNLQESFGYFNERQQIPDYFCQVCQQKVEKITKQTYLYDNPHYLIVNLKRIIFDLDTFQKIKVHTKLQFPQQFDVRPFMYEDKDQETSYNLKGVVIHSGTSQAGHYYSITKVHDKWYKFNDQTITQFGLKDLARQAYGGIQLSQSWGEQDYSTNAYILFYERQGIHHTSITTQEQFSTFKQQVQTENSKFYIQMQVHQQSYFEFLNQVYKSYRPIQMGDLLSKYPFDQNWADLAYVSIYQKLYSIYRKILNFIVIFYQIKPATLFTVGQVIYELLYFLPQKSYEFLMNLQTEQYLKVLCAHNDITIRNIYKFILNKSIHVYVRYFGLNITRNDDDTLRILKMLSQLIQPINTKLIQDNILKSYYYFQMLKINIDIDGELLNYALQKELLGKLLDFIMGVDSPYHDPNAKSQNYPSIQSGPIMQMITRLVGCKKNLKGLESVPLNDSYLNRNLSVKQHDILGSMNFYRKMIQGKYDNCILTPVIYHMNYNDQQFSQAIVQVLLNSLNKMDQMDVSPIIFNHIKFLLLLVDEFTQQRLKWYLGISQLQGMDNLTYGMKEPYSQYLFYVSSVCFIQSQLYQPMLQILYMKRYCFNHYQIMGILTLLQLMISSDGYEWISYVDWIPSYLYRLKNQSHYGLQGQHLYVDNMTNLWTQLQNKLQTTHNLQQPLQNYIIGKNQQYVVKDTLYHQHYKITLWAHKTYILPNKPNGTMNQSLETDKSTLKYFLHNLKQPLQSSEVQSKWMVLTLHIDTRRKLKLQFKLEQFPHQIHIGKGQIKVNCPYSQQTLDQFLTVQVLPQPNSQDQYKMPHFGPEEPSPQKQIIDEIYYAQVQCPTCTYINIGQQNCEMCQNSLINARII